MFRKLSYFVFSVVLISACSPQNKPIISPENLVYADYEELPDPSPGSDSAWFNLDKPLHAYFGSTDVRYPKHQVPASAINVTKKLGTDAFGIEFQVRGNRLDWKGTAWKGEKVNLQLVLLATEDLSNVRVRVSDLSSSQGGRISAGAISANFVRYVITDEFGNACGSREPADFDSSLVADVIDVIPAMNIPARTVRPVWVQIEVPETIDAGRYSGKITIEAEGNPEVHPLTIDLRVKEHVLPPPSEWAFHLDLWQNPFAESRVHGVENWSADHFEAMKPSMELLAGAGQKVITTSIIHDPWNGQTYDIYESMVRWTKKADGGWEYDYTVFDQWVEYMSEIGINQQINCYSMVPWNLKFYYYDESLGRDTLVVAEPGTPEYDAHWRPMLEDFASHLKEKGWFERTTIAMDERPLDAMQAVIKLIKSVDEEFKISLAGHYHPEIVADIADYCIASYHRVGADTLEMRRKQGKKTTYYTCCVEAYPNTFTFSPPAESAWLAWHAAARDYDGYLRWAYNCWVEDPMRDTRFRSWPAGDTYLVYPGARSSVRFEKLIDGIEDYVKIATLKKEFHETGNTEGLQKLEIMLAPFRDISNLAEMPADKMLRDAHRVLAAF